MAAASRSLTDTEQKYTAIEIESLGVCCAMEKFSQYILGMKDVIIETDHKPLVTIFGNMLLDRLPPRIQGFKLRLQRFQYTMKSVKGSMNISADTLSRNTCGVPDSCDEVGLEEIEQYVNKAVTPHGSDIRLEKIRLEQKEDEVLCCVIRFVQTGWPAYLSSEDTLMKPYFDRRSELTINKRFLMIASRLVIPQSQRDQVLQDLQRGHLGITMSQSRARSRNSLWCPTMSTAIRDHGW